MEKFPKDGSTFVVERIDRTAFRWKKYKPQGAKQMDKAGRWQKLVINGEFYKWENCEKPIGELSHPTEDGPVSKAFKLNSVVDKKDAQIKDLKDRLQAIIDWCDIAMKNADEFDSHGVRNLDGPIFDAARAVLAPASL